MEENLSHPMVHDIMTEFSGLTGLSPAGSAPRRYLWTDAFAVCNFLELYHQTEKERYLDFALQLVNQVHSILGRHREDDARSGWISGLDEQEGRLHPTVGGLRIGKEMNERRASAPFDENLEWDRDGQYYHYLTKWMHALNCITRVTADPTYNLWAMALAKTAHARFIYTPSSGGQKRMYWKMSIDLSRPLVQSMGQHDPIDGFITYHQLQATAAEYSEESTELNLNGEIIDMADICDGKSWATDDPLGLGGILVDAYSVAQMIERRGLELADLLVSLLEAVRVGLESYARTNQLMLPADYRLAFRELGLSIGMRAIERSKEMTDKTPGMFSQRHRSQIEDLMRYIPLGQFIENFWLAPKSREADSWMTHRDINMVMLATSLAPDGFLTV